MREFWKVVGSNLAQGITSFSFFISFFISMFISICCVYIYTKKKLLGLWVILTPQGTPFLGTTVHRILCLVCVCPNMPEHVVILLSDWCRIWSTHFPYKRHSHPFTFATSSEKEHRPASSVALTEFVTPRDTVTHTHTLVSRHFTKSTLDNEQMLLCDWLRPI